MQLEFTLEPMEKRPAAASRRGRSALRRRLAAKTQVRASESGPVTRVEPVHVDRRGKTQLVARPQVSGELDAERDANVALKTEAGRPALHTVA